MILMYVTCEYVMFSKVLCLCQMTYFELCTLKSNFNRVGVSQEMRTKTDLCNQERKHGLHLFQFIFRSYTTSCRANSNLGRTVLSVSFRPFQL
jgi:hypothetical protein